MHFYFELQNCFSGAILGTRRNVSLKDLECSMLYNSLLYFHALLVQCTVASDSLLRTTWCTDLICVYSPIKSYDTEALMALVLGSLNKWV